MKESVDRVLTVTLLLASILLLWGVFRDDHNIGPSARVVELRQPIVVRLPTMPLEGAAEAPVRVIEISDFECPYCKSFATQRLPTIKRYVETRRAAVGFVNCPLTSVHPHAMAAAVAAMCALPQGKFWQVHDILFRSADLSVGALARLPAQASLDSREYNECTTSGWATQRLREDEQIVGRLHITVTPTVAIGRSRGDQIEIQRMFTGVPQTEQLTSAIERVADSQVVTRRR
jgi:protein-disulfide isomerase